MDSKFAWNIQELPSNNLEMLLFVKVTCVWSESLFLFFGGGALTGDFEVTVWFINLFKFKIKMNPSRLAQCSSTTNQEGQTCKENSLKLIYWVKVALKIIILGFLSSLSFFISMSSCANRNNLGRLINKKIYNAIFRALILKRVDLKTLYKHCTFFPGTISAMFILLFV